MNGVVGYYRPGETVKPAVVRPLFARIKHRGDDGGLWCDGPVGLGHRTSNTGAGTNAAGPFVTADGRLAIVGDLRLDNRNELFEQLDLTGTRANVPDSQLALAAYREWGESCPEHLLGAFVFVVYDEQAGRLFCARDHLGVKPLYYCYENGQFAFGSELRPVLAAESASRTINEDRIAAYLLGDFSDEQATFYEDVRRLPPGHVLTVTTETAQTQEYWSPTPKDELSLPSDEAYAKRFRELFVEAVRCRLRGTGPVGTMLSGGLDSSSITCVAAELTDQPVHAVSAVFDEVPASDEQEYAEAVRDSAALDSHIVRADTISPLENLDDLLERYQEPFYAPNLYIHRHLYRVASEQGAGIVLDGLNGDPVVSHGIDFLPELVASGRWITLTREINALARRMNGLTRWRLLLSAIGPHTPAPAKWLWHRLRGNIDSQESISLFTPEFADRINAANRTSETENSGSRTERESHADRLSRGVIPFRLEVADVAAAMHGVEPRYPFLDRRLVEFCLSLPPEQKLRNGWTRHVLRRAMEEYLPQKVQWREGKANLAPGFNRGLERFERNRLERLLVTDPGPLDQYVDLTVVNDAFDRLFDGGDHSDALIVWKASTLRAWLEAQ
jgi:asparagine synthase (glutamine-hydrolysing)